jgi:NAD(P)-dependent dehydrogenase (short-subunit alcohol dehydrogenase family)
MPASLRSTLCPPSKFDGRAVLVTGGLGGIGTAIAEDLATRGATVYLARRPGSPIPDRPAWCEAVHDLELDVTSEPEWARALAGIESACGALYGLVNNAALLEPARDFLELDLAAWRRQLSVNLDGSFLGCRSAMRLMARTGGGAIVNVSSGAAWIPVPEAAAYCVSKSAVLALTRLAAKAGGRHRVRVNAVLPGAIDTPMLWRNLGEGESASAFMDALTHMHPIGRIGMPADVARAVAFLLDPSSDFMTGAALSVDGGQLVN